MKQPEPFGKFLLYGQVAVGGMAEIYKARYADPSMPQYDIALKRILPSYTEDESFVTMFKDEGEIALRLKHPNIVNIFEVGEVNNDWYIAMEFINGTDIRVLSDACEKYHKHFTPTQVARIVCETAKALYYAHTATAADGSPLNIVHRDCTPHNIMVSDQGQVKLMDFGIAKAASRATKTRVGTVKGKSAYMSPEQARGKVLDGRSDMFTLGTVGWELLTGYRLFKANSDFEILTKVLKSEILHPSELDSNVPRELGDIMMITLKRDRDTRYPHCQALADDLENWIQTYGDGSDQNLGTVLLALTNKQGHSYNELPDYVPGSSNYDYVDGDFKPKPGAGANAVGGMPAGPGVPGGPQPTMPVAPPQPMTSQPMMPGAPQPSIPFAQQTMSAYPDPSSVLPAVTNKLPIGYVVGYVILIAITIACGLFAFKKGSSEAVEMPKFAVPEAYPNLKTRPPGAYVVVHGQKIKDEKGEDAQTPIYSFRSKLGETISFTFEKEGYESVTVEREIVLTNQEIEITMLSEKDAAMQKLTSFPKLVIETDPSGVELTINGEAKGKSPVTLEDLEFGTELKIEGSESGYEDLSETIVISKNIETPYSIALQQKSGKSASKGSKKSKSSNKAKGDGTIVITTKYMTLVKLDGTISKLFKDGQSQSFSVSAGSHKIDVTCPKHASFKSSKSYNVNAGQTVKVSFDCAAKSWK